MLAKPHARDHPNLTETDHKVLAQELHDRWRDGESKSQLEIEYWNDGTSHGKAFTAYLKKWLGIATERRSTQSRRIDELEDLLIANGIAPPGVDELGVEHQLLAKARESALAGIRTYNDPAAGFRTETFSLLMVIAWNCLLQAVLERENIDYTERDANGEVVEVDGRPKALGTMALAKLVLPSDHHRATLANLDFILRLRNLVAHRYLPRLDTQVAGEAQAMLLNFEQLLVGEFGQAASLGDQLCVPLQLSAFRSTATMQALREAQSNLPLDVVAFLAKQREDLPVDILSSRDYCFAVFLVPTTANRESSADTSVKFIDPDKVSEELRDELSKLGVVTKNRTRSVASADLLRPSEVVEQVAGRIQQRFTMHTHTQCWRHFKVRPPEGAGEPEATTDQYCRWDRLQKGYGYTQAWVEKLVRHLSKNDNYEEIAGAAE